MFPIMMSCIEKHQSYKAFVNYQLWRHIDDVIEALNLKINDIFKSNTSSYIMLPNLSFLQSTVKDSKVIRPS